VVSYHEYKVNEINNKLLKIYYIVYVMAYKVELICKLK